MNILIIIGLSLALSIDSFAISIISGSQSKTNPKIKLFKLPIFFSFSHILSATLGWLIGYSLDNCIASFDHWLAFILLSFIGIKMIMSSKNPSSAHLPSNHISKTQNLIPICFATSIDALALGLSLALLNIKLILPVIIIFLIIFTTSMIGVLIGKKLNHKISQKADLLGGVILILIGLKILFDHLI